MKKTMKRNILEKVLSDNNEKFLTKKFLINLQIALSSIDECVSEFHGNRDYQADSKTLEAIATYAIGQEAYNDLKIVRNLLAILEADCKECKAEAILEYISQTESMEKIAEKVYRNICSLALVNIDGVLYSEEDQEVATLLGVVSEKLNRLKKNFKYFETEFEFVLYEETIAVIEKRVSNLQIIFEK